jgi:hypothetical protein
MAIAGSDYPFLQHRFLAARVLLQGDPFTPATGHRLALSKHAPASSFTELQRALEEEMHRLGASSWHMLFADADTARQLESKGMLSRQGVQYHWFNQDYRDFGDFLASFSSRKRKNLRKERLRVAEQGIMEQACALLPFKRCD